MLAPAAKAVQSKTLSGPTSILINGHICVQGNTQGRRASQDVPVARNEGMGSPASPGSPLTYHPQMQMEPLMPPSLSDTFALSGRQTPHEFHLAGWPAQPKLVPTVITCRLLALPQSSPSLCPSLLALPPPHSSAIFGNADATGLLLSKLGCGM